MIAQHSAAQQKKFPGVMMVCRHDAKKLHNVTERKHSCVESHLELLAKILTLENSSCHAQSSLPLVTMCC